MSYEPADADLEPYTSSGYSWRWEDPRYDVLPGSVLRSIRALRRPKAHELSHTSLTIDEWVRSEPGREIDAAAHDQYAVSKWLDSRAPGSEMVFASWSEDECVYLPWSVFTVYWSSFCYSSSDDVTIWPLHERWGLSYSHSGTFYWRSRE